MPHLRFLHPAHARLAIVIASLVGLFASAYLLVVYVNGAPIACGTVAGCELVRASEWAYLYGIPRPLFGVVFYAGMIALLVLRVTTSSRPHWLYRLTMLGAIVGIVESVYLFLIQWLAIGAFCTWCFVSGVATLAIALVAPSDRNEEERRIGASHELRWYAYALLVFLPVAFAGILFLTRVATPDVPQNQSIERR